MKKNSIAAIVLILFFLSLIGLPVFVRAYAIKAAMTPSDSLSPSASPSGNPDLMNKIDQQINALKNRIVSRTAELKLVEKRGIIGTIESISGTEIKITDIHKDIRFIDVDELTKFASAGAKGTFDLSDLTKGTTIGVLGNYNKESKRLLARFINTIVLPRTVSGNVSTIDKKNYQFHILTASRDNSSTDSGSPLIDVETVTKTYVYTANDGEKKGGFTNISPEERVYAIGFTDKTNPNMIIASRIILFPELSPNLSISPSSTNSPVPTKEK